MFVGVLNFTNNLFTGEIPNSICEATGSGLMDLKFLEVDCEKVQCTCCSPSCFDNDAVEEISLLSNTDDVIFWKNPRTPQNLAMSWYSYDDTSDYQNSASFSIQRFALAVFFFASNGAQWTSSKGFLSGDDECSWEGIICDESSQLVEEINLRKFEKYYFT